jgi:hypothetical protein
MNDQGKSEIAGARADRWSWRVLSDRARRTDLRSDERPPEATGTDDPITFLVRMQAPLTF